MRNVFFVIVFCLFLCSSCKLQTPQKASANLEVNKGNVPTKNQMPFDNVISDYDPYFIETDYITSLVGPKSITRNIMEDRNGNMWFASWEGIVKYNPFDDEKGLQAFTNYTNKEGLRRYHMFSVFEDKSGIIWFGSIRAGVYRYDPELDKAGKNAFTNYTVANGLAGDAVGCIFQDSKGVLWFGTDTGVSTFDPQSNSNGKVVFKNYTVKDGLKNEDINSIIEDKKGNIWLGCRGELSIFYPNDEVNGHFKEFTKQDGSPFVNVRTVIEDKKGNIWLGGNDGLWCISQDKSKFTNHTTMFTGYIYEDRKGMIYYGATDSNTRNWSLYQYSASAAHSTMISPNVIIEEDGQVFGITEDSKGNIWYGHESGICRYNPASKSPEKAFTFFNQDERK